MQILALKACYMCAKMMTLSTIYEMVNHNIIQCDKGMF